MKFMRSTLGLVGLGIFGFAQAGSLWATDTSGNLYTVDTTTAAATFVGNHGLSLESLAMHDATGTLYGADSSGDLYSLNTLNGAATLIGNTGLGNIEGMDFAGNFLFGFDFSNQPTLYTLDTTTAAASLYVQSNVATGSVRTFCFDSGNNNALMATDNPLFQTLHSMVPSGTTTNIGSLGNEGVYGMDLVGNDYFGLGSEGQLWQIDMTTGGKTLIGDTGDQFWLGAASAAQPVPEPATIAAIGLGLAAVARRRRKSA